MALAVEVASKSTEDNDRGTKAIKYAKAGIPSYWRVARDDTVYVHALVAEEQYGIVATVKPGTTWTAIQPSGVVVDPAVLTADL